MKKSSAVNWDELRERLARSCRSLEQTGESDSERTRAILRTRTERLRRRTVEHSAGRTAQVVVFSLGSRTHAVELEHLAEVLLLPPCSRVPGTPLHFSGAINVRGEFHAVLDLARFLGLPEGQNGNAGFVLMLRHLSHRIGWKVDGVEGIREIALTDVVPAGEGKYVKGLASGTLLLVDARKVLADIFPNADVFPNEGVVNA